MSELNKDLNKLSIGEDTENIEVIQDESAIDNNEKGENGNAEAEMPSTSDVLSATLNNFSNSFSSIYQSLALNLNQSMNMVIGMNKLMDNLLLNSLKSSINISTDENKEIVLSVNLLNIGKFPLPGLTYSISLRPKNLGEGEDFNFNDYLSINNDDNTLSRCKNFTQNAQSLSEFKPGEGYSELIKFNPSSKTQYIGEILIEFLNPGTMTPLKINNQFGVYLLDFCELSYVQLSTPHSISNYIELRLNPQFLRSQFKLNPLDGIAPNLTQFNLNLPGDSGSLSIYLIDPEQSLCYLEYSKDTDKDMIESLVWELNALNTQ